MTLTDIPETLRHAVRRGMVIPAHPLALTANRKLDERRQRALTRYYIDAGVGGVAVGVHTTQFAIRDPKVGLLEPVLRLAAETVDAWSGRRPGGKAEVLKVAGVCGETAQAVAEAELARSLGYHAVLLSLAALRDASIEQLIAHCREVASGMPIIGFYLQPAVGGRVLPYAFWRRFVEIKSVLAIKVAPFNRYQTLDVARAVAEAGRGEAIALYTGNDDQILLDLLTPFRFSEDRRDPPIRIVGGLLGHWAVWTRKAVQLLEEIQAQGDGAGEGGALDSRMPRRMLELASQITDANAAFFDAANGFRGCIAGIHEVLRRQGLFQGTWCLDPDERLSPGQDSEIDRVARAYPHLNDDAFVSERLDEWMAD